MRARRNIRGFALPEPGFPHDQNLLGSLTVRTLAAAVVALSSEVCRVQLEELDPAADVGMHAAGPRHSEMAEDTRDAR